LGNLEAKSWKAEKLLNAYRTATRLEFVAA
jgi:hypothetical protein